MRPRIGFLVPPPDWSALIVGVYSKAVSLLHSDSALVSLVRGAQDMEARAIALEESWEPFVRSAGQAFERAGEKLPVFVEYRRPAGPGDYNGLLLALRIGDPRGSGNCSGGSNGSGRYKAEPSHNLALEGAELWDPRDELRRSCRTAQMTGKDLTSAIASSRDLLDKALARTSSAAGGADSIGGEGPFAQAFTRLREQRDFPACLVGFGPGTTPAGDDWLAGFLAAAELGGLAADLAAGPSGAATESGGLPSESPNPHPGLAGLRDEIRMRLPRTGAAGRALLLGALAGAPPAYLLRVRQACLLCAADGGAKLSPAIAAAQRHGASSGRDSLEGFQAGLESIQDFSPRD